MNEDEGDVVTVQNANGPDSPRHAEASGGQADINLKSARPGSLQS